MVTLLTLLMACTGTGAPAEHGTAATVDDPQPDPTDSDTTRTDTDTTDPTDTTDTETTDTDGLVGVVIDPPLAPPTFAVLDQTGAARTAEWLVGHPTVVWFFREADGST